MLQLCSASTRAGSSVCPMRRLGLHSQISSAPGILLWGNCPYELTDTTDFYQSWEFCLSHGKAGTGQPSVIYFRDTSLRILPLWLNWRHRFLPELGLLFVLWEGWECIARLHLLHGYFFEDIAPVAWLTPQVPTRAGSSVCLMGRLGLGGDVSCISRILLWGYCPCGLTDTTVFYQSWEFCLSSRKAGTAQPKFIYFTNTSFRMFLLLLDWHHRCCSSWAWLTPR